MKVGGRRILRPAAGILIIGAAVTAWAAGAMGSSSPVAPTLTATQATFVVPAQPQGKWIMKLWTMPKPTALVGQATGTSGTLTVAVPQTYTCEFQIDVRYAPLGSQDFSFYSGLIATVPGCNEQTTTTTTSTTTTTMGTTTTTVLVPPTGPSGGIPTSPSSAVTTAQTASTLAVTGVGPGMTWTALLGALLLLLGAVLWVVPGTSRARRRTCQG